MERKALRLPSYDYSRAGVYFLTLCAKDKAPLFGKVCVGGGALDAPKVELSAYGAVVERWIADCTDKYEDLAILKYVIMPNHVHLIVELRDGPSRAPAPTQGNGIGPSYPQGARHIRKAAEPPTAMLGAPAPTRANQTIPSFASALKRMTGRYCGVAIWQRGYYDHVIRNDADFLRVWNYIDTNPAKWAEDEYFVR